MPEYLNSSLRASNFAGNKALPWRVAPVTLVSPCPPQFFSPPKTSRPFLGPTQPVFLYSKNVQTLFGAHPASFSLLQKRPDPLWGPPSQFFSPPKTSRPSLGPTQPVFLYSRNVQTLSGAHLASFSPPKTSRPSLGPTQPVFLYSKNVQTLSGAHPANFSLLQKRPDPLWGPPSLQFNVYRGSFLAVNRPGRDDDHSPPPSANIHNAKSCAFSTPV